MELFVLIIPFAILFTIATLGFIYFNHSKFVISNRLNTPLIIKISITTSIVTLFIWVFYLNGLKNTTFIDMAFVFLICCLLAALLFFIPCYVLFLTSKNLIIITNKKVTVKLKIIFRNSIISLIISAILVGFMFFRNYGFEAIVPWLLTSLIVPLFVFAVPLVIIIMISVANYTYKITIKIGQK